MIVTPKVKVDTVNDDDGLKFILYEDEIEELRTLPK